MKREGNTFKVHMRSNQPNQEIKERIEDLICRGSFPKSNKETS